MKGITDFCFYFNKENTDPLALLKQGSMLKLKENMTRPAELSKLAAEGKTKPVKNWAPSKGNA